jgi:hypothetical protein
VSLLNLTPLGPSWGWGSRLIEIAVQSLSLVFVQPLVLVHRGTGWLLEKILP